MQIVELKTKDLIPYEGNAKEHPPEQVDQICQSIEAFGFNDPIAVDENNIIIEGHGRLLAAQKLGLKTVPVIKLSHLNDGQKQAYILAHNKLTLNTGFDVELLKQELLKIQESDLDIALTGFDVSEVSAYLKNLDKDEPQGDLDDVPEPPADPITQTGDLYEIGNHRLLCGDSTKIEDVERLMNGAKADMVFTDPPYNVNYTGKTKQALKIDNDSKSDSDFYKFLYDVYTCLLNSTKPGGAIYVAHADMEGVNFRKAMVDAGWAFKQCCVWIKDCFVMGRQDYHWQHEPILYGWNPAGSHNWYSDRKQSTVWNFVRPKANREHPTMKPVELVQYPLNNSSRIGDLVLDLFGGSGSTMVAAHMINRKSCLMELDPRYCDVIINRMRTLWPDLVIKRNGELI